MSQKKRIVDSNTPSLARLFFSNLARFCSSDNFGLDGEAARLPLEPLEGEGYLDLPTNAGKGLLDRERERLRTPPRLSAACRRSRDGREGDDER